jgi:hypothetical protein
VAPAAEGLGVTKGKHFDPDAALCHKCGARSHQVCDRYKIQFPIACPRDAQPRGAVMPDPDASLGAELCYEALRSTHDRFDPRAASPRDERPAELDFNVEEYRR